MSENANLDKHLDSLFEKVATLIEQARQHVVTTANIAEVYTKYHIGRYIVEEEQQGNERAAYGKQVLKGLSEKLTERFGKGWSYPNLRKIRQFYLTYSNLIIGDYQIDSESHLLSNSDNQRLSISQNEFRHKTNPSFTLSWTHYLVLMQVENPDARSFYEIEATQQQWSVRQLLWQAFRPWQSPKNITH